MRNVKIFLTFLLSMALALCMLVACFDETMVGEAEINGKTSYEAYSEAQEQVSKELTNFEYTCVQEQNLYSGTSKVATYTTTENGKRNGNNLEAVVTSDILGGTTTSLFVDGWYYCEVSGQKIKANISLDGFAKIARGTDATADDLFSSYLIDIPQDWLKNVGFVAEDDGYKCTMTVDGNKYWKQYSEAPLVKNLLENTGMDMTIDSCEMVIHFDSDLMVKMFEQVLEFTATVSGVTVKDYVTQSMEITNVGGVGEISAPADADSYIDYTATIKSTYGITD